MRKFISRCLAAVLACTLLAGCGTQGSDPQVQNVEASEPDAIPPLESVTMMCNYKAVEAPNENNSML